MNGLDSWEARWAPYSEADYAAVLAAIRPDDVVLEIGAGDLRLARRMTQIARQVIAWEMQPELLAAAEDVKREHWLAGSEDRRAWIDPVPALAVVCTDARSESVPPGVTVAVLLMRHCTHYALYVEKLRAAGCQRLVTNARWGVGVEVIDMAPAAPFASVEIGWYACRRCGATGWAGEDATAVNAATLETVIDVEGCPACCGEVARTCQPDSRPTPSAVLHSLWYSASVHA
jgi:hypothetical protein